MNYKQEMMLPIVIAAACLVIFTFQMTSTGLKPDIALKAERR
jgi:hypothetical protein